jgi:hypothetical protein
VRQTLHSVAAAFYRGVMSAPLHRLPQNRIPAVVAVVSGLVAAAFAFALPTIGF